MSTNMIVKRGRLGRAVDAALFPVRALFVHEDAVAGISSLRDERMYRVAELCKGRVLDVGCGRGNIFIKHYIGEENGVGVDVFAYEGVTNVVSEITALPFDDASFDTVTLIAVGGHIPKHLRAQEFQEFARLLKPGGRVIMTEGEPVTQFLLHKWQEVYYPLMGKVDMDSERGMEEEEEYCMPLKEIYEYLNTPPLRLVERHKLMWRLNNIYVAEKI